MTDDARHPALVDQAVAAVAELMSHLPDDELADDEPLELGFDAVPGALVALRSGTALYALDASGDVLRYRRLAPGREELIGFRNRERVGVADIVASLDE